MTETEMKKELCRKLKDVNSEVLRTVPYDICKLLTGKGLSLRQAEALLDYAKDLLKDAKI